MRDLSMSMLDLVMNAVRAQATVIEMTVIECEKTDSLTIKVKDNGTGMSQKMCEQAKRPFFTTKEEHSVGLGLPLFSERVRQCGGRVWIDSVEGDGTLIQANMGLSHLDRPPFGDMHQTLYMVIYLEPAIDFIYTHQVNGERYRFETAPIKERLGGFLINHPSVMEWIFKEIEQGDLSFTTY